MGQLALAHVRRQPLAQSFASDQRIKRHANTSHLATRNHLIIAEQSARVKGKSGAKSCHLPLKVHKEYAIIKKNGPPMAGKGFQL
jgi:hypothetical protein